MRFLGRTTLALVLGAAVLVPAQGALGASVSSTDAKDKPTLLAKQAHGKAAVAALGENLDEAAAINAMNAGQLRRELTEDPSLWVGRDGRAFYVDSAPASADTEISEVQSASAALEDTFTLHRLPGSAHTIYLDFGGMTLASNSWWVQNGGMSAQTFTGYSQDADPAFNDTEKTYIQQVWRIIAEKYAAFDVDVTTENLGSDRYNRTSLGDLTWGTRVVITSDDAAHAQACGTCAGRALIDVFDTVDSGQYEPAWVFTDVLGGVATLAANAAAHEIGHTLGLDHDGANPSTSYYSGHSQWVPIMGITNSKPVAQFSKGEYTNANNTEDDLAIIAVSGAPLRTDDHGGTTGTATTLSPAATYELDGIIRSAADKDVFAVNHYCATALTATATGIGTGSALDLKVSVYNSGGTLVGANDPASYNIGSVAFDMDATYTTSAAEATYYVEVDGVGSGGLGATPDPSAGYTDYGSIGQYHLAITNCSAGSSPPSAPQTLTASPTLRSTNGSVSWSAPASPGSAPITGYTVTGLPGGSVELPAGTTSAASTSLAPGTTYGVSVVAKNLYGSSTPAAVNLTVPTWVPSAAPTISRTVTGKDVAASWTTADDYNPGNATITGWATVLKKGTTTIASATGPASPRTVSYTSLAPGDYTLSVTVVATADDTAGRTAGTTSFTIAGDKPSAPQNLVASTTDRSRSIALDWDPPSSTGDDPTITYRISGFTPGSFGLTEGTSLTMTTLNPGTTYNVSVVAANQYGDSSAATTSARIDTWLPTAAPTVTPTVTGNDVSATWTNLTNTGNATLTGWSLVLKRGTTTVASSTVTSPRSISYANLPTGTYTLSVTVTGSADLTSGTTAGSASFFVPGKPTAPKIGTASSGTKGGTVNAVARWAAPSSTGGSAITSYKVIAYKLTAANNVAKAYYSTPRAASSRSYVWALPAGRYKFKVIAYNAVGASPASAYSAIVASQ